MIGLIEGVRREMSVTILHVTHSLVEAEQLADQIYVIDGEHLPKLQRVTAIRKDRRVSA